MKRFKKRIFLFCLSGILLSGCREKLTSGEIYNKEFFPASTVTVIMPIVHTNGKSNHTTYIPMIYRYPDRWRVDIQSLEADKNGKRRTTSYWVTEEVYEDCVVGGMFEFNPKADAISEPVERKEGGAKQ